MRIYAGYPPYMGTSMYYDIIAGKTMETAYIQGYLYEKVKRTAWIHPV